MKIKFSLSGIFFVTILLVLFSARVEAFAPGQDLSDATKAAEGEACGASNNWKECKTDLACACDTSSSGNVCVCRAGRNIGQSCGGDSRGTCEAGSFSCSTGRMRVWDMSNNCISGAICCESSADAPAGGATGGGTPADGSRPGGSTTAPVSDGVYIPTAQETGLSDLSVKDILANVLSWMLEIVGVVALIAFVISGIQYILASGNEKEAETAKNNMKYAIMGMVVVLGSFVIIQAIDYALRGGRGF